ncbi:MAG: META domain-containing protein [Bacteroidota bacterium]
MKHAYLLLVLLFLTCNTPKDMPTQKLVGTEWQLQSYTTAAGKQVLAQGETATLKFETEMKLAGHSGCNAFGGDYQMAGNKMTAQVFSTKRYCQEVNVQERAIFSIFSAGGTLTVSESTLTISDGKQRLDYVPIGSKLSSKATPESAAKSTGETKRYVGMLRYMADAAVFTDCADGEVYSVATGQGAWITCEKAYTRMGKSNGENAFMVIDGELIKNPEPEGREYLLKITRLVSGNESGKCP